MLASPSLRLVVTLAAARLVPLLVQALVRVLMLVRVPQADVTLVAPAAPGTPGAARVASKRRKVARVGQPAKKRAAAQVVSRLSRRMKMMRVCRPERRASPHHRPQPAGYGAWCGTLGAAAVFSVASSVRSIW